MTRGWWAIIIAIAVVVLIAVVIEPLWWLIRAFIFVVGIVTIAKWIVEATRDD